MSDSKLITAKDFARLFKLTLSIHRDSNLMYSDLRNQLGDQNMLLRVLQIDSSQIKESVRRLGILCEDLDERFKTDSELLKSNLNVKTQVDDHEDRIQNIETDQKLLKKTVRVHSRQLKTKSA